MRKTLRAIVAAGIRYSGLLAIWRFLHRRDVIILVGHGTAPELADSQWRPLRPQLPPEMLDRCLRLMSKFYRFISFNEAVAVISGVSHARSRCVAVTFDDGYRSNLLWALPVMRRYKVRPLVFLTTGHIERRKPFWFDRLDFALQSGAQVHGRDFTVGAKALKMRAETRSEIASSYTELRRLAKAALRPDTLMLEELDGIAETLECEGGRKLADIFESDTYSGVLTWQQVVAGAAEVDFGSHTVDHIRLALVNPQRAEQELLKSKQQIELATAKPCRHFAYPDGNFTPEAARLVHACGYSSAVTMEPGLNSWGDDLMLLKRIPFPLQGTDSELLLELSGFMHWLTSLRSYFSKGKKS
jgi:peptidoglycan/xylan/chitin deacetylase (PgdA/CDA1 family)